jgi:hypothetical protein
VQQDSSGIRHCTAKDINNSAATVGEYVPTPCLGLQLKIECRNSVIEDCMAVGCRTGLKSAGDSAEGNTSCRFKNIGIIAATDVSPLNTLEGTPLTNIPVDIRSTRLSDFSGITIYGTGATSPLPASATAVYFDGTCNKLDFRVMDWLVPGSSILELGVDSDDNVIEFSQMNSLVSAGAISVPLTNDRNLIEVGALNNTGIAAAFPVGYVSDAGSGNVIRRKAA